MADGAVVPKVLRALRSRLRAAAGAFVPVAAQPRPACRRQDRANPFANFFFGGFGNNYVDVRDEKRYRQYDALPGADLNEIDGRNFVKGTVEWNLPPWRFRRLGKPGFYATWLRPAIFVTGLTTNLDVTTPRRLASSGAQVDLRLGLLSALDLTLSVGGGTTVEDGYRPRHEVMVSLKVLR